MFWSEFYLLFAVHLFIFGLTGITVLHSNLIFVLMSIELMLLASGVLFVSSAVFYGDATGQVFALFILAIAAAETAVGLSLLVLIYKLKGTIQYSFLTLLKG